MKWIRGGSEGWDRAWVKDRAWDKADAQEEFQVGEEDRGGRW